MENFLFYIIELSLPLAIISVFFMARYFVGHKIYTWWQIRLKILWPVLTFEYRDHTRKNMGKVGLWFYIFWVCILVSFLAGLTSLAFELSEAPMPIVFLVLFSALLIIPLLSFAIYNMSKEKYY